MARGRGLKKPDDYDTYRFWQRVDVSKSQTACWSWLGGASAQGYGRFKLKGRLESSHRVAYAIANGDIPEADSYHGNVVMHLCDNPSCCNPRHLRLGDQRANVKDMDGKRRGGRGKVRRWDLDRVAEIIAMPGSSRELASRTELSDRYIRHAREGARKKLGA